MSSVVQSKPGEPPDPSAWLARHGDALYRYTLLHLADRDAAEDAVQKTLLAALEGYKSFSGRSSERTWLIGILKRKILDHIRRSSRRSVNEDLEATADYDADQFNKRGRWQLGPQKWGHDPSQAFEQQEFWDVFARCLSRLPPRLAFAFTQREVDGSDSERICKDLDVTATNLWTLLHRARTRMRRCLETNWFSRGS